MLLNGVDLKVKKGEFLVVLGHNGSGKSTLAKHMNALLIPTEGNVYVDGLDTNDEKIYGILDQRQEWYFKIQIIK